MNTKIKVEINLETWTKIKKMFEDNRITYEKLNINNVDEFINYIIDNFAKSSKQFDQLSEQMKAMMESIDVDNINIEELFKSIADASPKKKPDDNNNKKS